MAGVVSLASFCGWLIRYVKRVERFVQPVIVVAITIVAVGCEVFVVGIVHVNVDVCWLWYFEL